MALFDRPGVAVVGHVAVLQRIERTPSAAPRVRLTDAEVERIAKSVADHLRKKPRRR